MSGNSSSGTVAPWVRCPTGWCRDEAIVAEPVSALHSQAAHPQRDGSPCILDADVYFQPGGTPALVFVGSCTGPHAEASGIAGRQRGAPIDHQRLGRPGG